MLIIRDIPTLLSSERALGLSFWERRGSIWRCLYLAMMKSFLEGLRERGREGGREGGRELEGKMKVNGNPVVKKR